MLLGIFKNGGPYRPTCIYRVATAAIRHFTSCCLTYFKLCEMSTNVNRSLQYNNVVTFATLQ